MRHLTLFCLAAMVASCGPAPATAPTPPDYSAVFDGSAGRWIDLTHAFGDDTIHWPTDTAGFRLRELAYGQTEGGLFYASYEFASAEHGGTHLDAPVHFAEGRLTADAIPLSGLMGPAAVVDVTDRVTPDYLISVADLTSWEAMHGAIPGGAYLLLRTGWAERWSDRAAYLGTELTGPDAVADLHFPGLSEAAAAWLVAERQVAAVGIDTPSIDLGQSSDFRAHVVLYRKNVIGLEDLADLSGLPPTGAFVVALPMKIEGGSGGPLRTVAFVPADAEN